MAERKKRFAPVAKTSEGKRGRPSKFTPALALEICQRLGKGEPLTVICRDDHMPHDNTVRAWTEGDEKFSVDIARARETGFDAIALQALAIADETEHDTIQVGSGDNVRDAANTEWIGRSKLRVETRLKLLAKWDPKRYGEKLALGGADDLPPIRTMDLTALSPGELAQMEALLEKAKGPE